MPRIDKIRLDNYYNQYRNRTGPVKPEEEEIPGFDPKEPGVVYERSDPGGAKRTEKSPPEEIRKAKEAEPAATKEAAAAEGEEKASGGTLERILSYLRDTGSRILAFFKKALSDLWNGPEGAASDETPEEASAPERTEAGTKAEAPSSDANVRSFLEKTTVPGKEDAAGGEALEQIIASHDIDQLVRYVTEDGRKKPARSTDLLTIYNRQGLVNRVDPSDRKKILEGNFNDLKL